MTSYLKAAGIAVRIPRAWGRRAPAKPANEVTPDLSEAKPASEVTPDLSEAKPANEVTPDFVGLLSQPPSSPAGRVSACEPYRDLIEEKLSRGRNAKAIWQDLVTDHGYPGDYQTVKRFVRRLGGSKLPQAAGIILTEPGEEAQVDYGSGPRVRDPQTGKYRRTTLFGIGSGEGWLERPASAPSFDNRGTSEWFIERIAMCIAIDSPQRTGPRPFMHGRLANS